MGRSSSLCVGLAPALFSLALACAAQNAPQVTSTLTVAGNVAQPLSLTVQTLRLETAAPRAAGS